MPLIRFTAAVAVATAIMLNDEARPHSPGETAEATLATQPETPRAGERTALAFTLADHSGAPLQDLGTHHGGKLHVIIVSADMQVLGHIHPHGFGEQIEAGEAKVFFTFPRPGRYLVAADFMTADGPHAQQFTVEVAGSGDAAAPGNGPAAPPSIGIVTLEDGDRHTDPVLLQGTGEAGGYGVALQRPDKIEAGEPVTLTYRFTMNGAPVTNLRSYLDAPMHLAVVHDDLRHFLHEHGMLPVQAHVGHGSHEMSGDNHHGHHGYQGPAEFGPEIIASLSFPEPGTYYLFSQAAHGDALLISRIPVNVE
jgi:hypothetical protein